jgi:hypothetical protein
VAVVEAQEPLLPAAGEAVAEMARRSTRSLVERQVASAAQHHLQSWSMTVLAG